MKFPKFPLPGGFEAEISGLDDQSSDVIVVTIHCINCNYQRSREIRARSCTEEDLDKFVAEDCAADKAHDCDLSKLNAEFADALDEWEGDNR